ncbi:acyltransferase family-domain-containing protein [Cladorrhinum sp. PSN332]|nr:acyltransferase family-domain-containing protein [Cladorrhinum sp. PSN332]
MNGHAPSQHTLTCEENMVLLDEKSPSDIESEAGRADLSSRFSPPSSSPHPTTLRQPRSLVLRTVIFLLPSFLQPRGGSVPPRLSPTAYLDGMRGLAALFVFFCHYTYTCYVIAHGYGYEPPLRPPPTTPTPNNFALLKLPFLRLFYSGPPMVCVFFVISGYALSLRPLTQIRSRQFSSLSATLSSLIFRRAIRLFLPCAVSTLLIVAMARIGLYEWTREFAYDEAYMRNVQETHFRSGGKEASLRGQVAEWAGMLFEFVHVWDWEAFGGSTGIDVHLWTIPVEFRASMFVFLGVAGLSRLKAKWRFLGLAGLGLFAFRSARWEVMLFYWGVGLAEVDAGRWWMRDKPALGEEKEKKRNIRGGRESKHWKSFWAALSVLGLYLMSQPDYGSDETPGWVFLTGIIPGWWKDGHRFWQSFGAMLFVLAVGRSRGWQRLFESSMVQYLGRISYAMYLMHGPVLHTVGYAIERWVWTNVTGIETLRAYNAGFALASVFVVPIVIWVSDVFWRGVDAPVVKFAKRVEGFCSISE